MISESIIVKWLSYFNDNLLLPIILSFIAATIFWLFFNYFPRKRKHKKIRPKVEFDIYQMQFNLSFYFYKIFQVSPWRRVENQHEIQAGCLTKKEIKIWLQDKCLNDTFKFDENKEKFISIGNDLEKIALQYSERLNKLLNFIDYLTVEEILLLQKIEYKLFTYNYKRNAESKVGDKSHYPLVPNLAYMTRNFYELYQAYLALREIILDYKLIDKSINKSIVQNLQWMKASDYYYRGEYKKCIRLIKKNKKSDDKWLLFKSLLKLGEKEKGYKILRDSLNSTKLELVSLRNNLRPFIIEDKQVQDICKELRNEAELKYCLKTVIEEISLRDYYEKQNLALKKYYDNKRKKHLAKGKENYEKMKNSL